jgi:RNA polymerase-binding transcription factor DksA
LQKGKAFGAEILNNGVKKMWGLETKDWVTIAATIAGPILAVQAQKWVERARASAQRRDWIFTTLMGTRQARVSFDHVRALNMIDLAYYGTRIPVFGWVWRNKREKEVLTTWHDYHTHLSLPADGHRPQNEAEQRDWNGRGDELFTNLLDRLAVELQQQAMRHLAIEVLAGNKPLSMEVKAWPIDAAVAEQQRNTQAELVQNQREMVADFKQILERLTEHAVGHRAEAVAPAEARAAEATPVGR